MAEEKKKSSWFSKIETREDALRVVKESSTNFYVLAAIQAGLGLLVLHQSSLLFDVVVMVAGAFFLRRFNSRVAAGVLLLLSLLSGWVTLENRVNGPGSGAGGTNIILAAVMIWAAVRALQATLKLSKLGPETSPMVRS